MIVWVMACLQGSDRGRGLATTATIPNGLMRIDVAAAERKSRTPVKVLIAGLDGSGKSTSLNLLVKRMADRHRVLRLGSNREPRMFFRGQDCPALRVGLSERIASVRRVACKARLYRVFLACNFAFKYILARYLERFAGADLIVYEADRLLHPAVYVTYHVPTSRRFGARTRFRLLRALFGSRTNLLAFYLEIDPEVAVQRIHARGGERAGHENYEDLRALESEFGEVLDAAVDSGLEVVRLDSGRRTPEEIATEMARVVETKLVGAK